MSLTSFTSFSLKSGEQRALVYDLNLQISAIKILTLGLSSILQQSHRNKDKIFTTAGK